MPQTEIALLHRGLHFLIGRPDVAQENVFASLVLTKRVFHKINIDAACDRVSDN